jgi:hypothetical protein
MKATVAPQTAEERLSVVKSELCVIAREIEGGDLRRMHLVVELTEQKRTLTVEAQAEEGECAAAESRRAREEAAQAREQLDAKLVEIASHRAKFLEAYRNANLELGLYFQSLEDAGPLVRLCSTVFGPMPPDMSALRELQLGHLPAESIADLVADTGTHFRTMYPVTVMRKKF